MADDNNQQNQQKQKGGNQNGPKMGITLGTYVTATNNPNLGETIRGAVADGLGFTAGAIATGVFSFFINKLIKKFKPAATTPALFPTAEDRAGRQCCTIAPGWASFISSATPTVTMPFGLSNPSDEHLECPSTFRLPYLRRLLLRRLSLKLRLLPSL